MAVCFTAVATSKSDVYFGSWWVGDAEFWLHLIDNINDGNCGWRWTPSGIVHNRNVFSELLFSSWVSFQLWNKDINILSTHICNIWLARCVHHKLLSNKHAAFRFHSQGKKCKNVLHTDWRAFGASTYIWREKENSHYRIRGNAQYSCWSVLSNRVMEY